MVSLNSNNNVTKTSTHSDNVAISKFRRSLDFSYSCETYVISEGEAYNYIGIPKCMSLNTSAVPLNWVKCVTFLNALLCKTKKKVQDIILKIVQLQKGMVFKVEHLWALTSQCTLRDVLASCFILWQLRSSASLYFL